MSLLAYNFAAMPAVWVAICKDCDLEFFISKVESSVVPDEPLKLRLLCPHCQRNNTYGVDDLFRALYISMTA